MYDYVIVGAGSAGCVLAARLTEDPDTRVLLLEAGDRDLRPEIHIPVAFSRLFHTAADWDYTTEPQPGAAGRALYWPRGRVLGGSSSINAMIYIRGHAADYDGWADAGCDGWGYADVLPLFKKSEDNVRGASAYHGAGGPLSVVDPQSPSPVSTAFVEAAEAVGQPHNPDFNGAQQEGAGLYQLTQRRGRRASAATAFLRPAMRRPNLVVWTGAHAHRVVVEGGVAVGVDVERQGSVQRVRATREVVLCGGAVNTPQLLLLSGIGPADELRAVGLDVVADRPGVGENLQDHLIVGLHHRLTATRSLKDAEGIGALLGYLWNRTGMMTSNVAEAGLFVRTDASEPAPDIQFHVAPGHFFDHGQTPPQEHGFSVGPTLLTPESRGRVSLRTADPQDAPRIDPRVLSAPRDVERLVAGLQLAREIAEAEPLRSLWDRALDPAPAGPSPSDLADHVRRTCETLYHPVGTCRMGPDDDAVVDPELRVRGVDGLRVADASVMPVIPRGNTNAPTLMVAEKAAVMIRAGVPA